MRIWWSNGRKIFIINKLNIALINAILKNLKAAPDIALNGKIAIEKSKLSKYDILLLDMQMPEMDGY